MPAARAASSRLIPSRALASASRRALTRPSRSRRASARSSAGVRPVAIATATMAQAPGLLSLPGQLAGRRPRSRLPVAGMSRPLRRLRRLLARGLERTQGLCPPIRRAYAWVHRAARILGNAAGEPAEAVRRRLDGLLAALARHRAKAGPLAGAVDHFLKVTRSYRPGLFHCYAVADLPRTDNDLERLFGSYRPHQRRGARPPGHNP